jgi:hypothetical protein
MDERILEIIEWLEFLIQIKQELLSMLHISLNLHL